MNRFPFTQEYFGPKIATIPKGGNSQAKRKITFPRHQLPILAFDPGGTTGWSLLVLPTTVDGQNVFNWPQDVILRNKIDWIHGQVDCIVNEDNAVSHLTKLIDQWPAAAVVVEDFILRPHRNEMSRELLSPVRITAKLEHHLWKHNREMWLQMPSQAKGVCSDERLRAWGVYTREGGMQHARDADRHAVLFLRRCMGGKGIATRDVGWPFTFEPSEA